MRWAVVHVAVDDGENEGDEEAAGGDELGHALGPLGAEGGRERAEERVVEDEVEA